MIGFTSVVILWLALTACGQTESLEIKRQVEECGNAFIAGDYNKFVERTHPELVKLMGGKEKMVAELSKGKSQMKEEGVSFISVSADLPKEPVTIGLHGFSIVPYRLKMKVPDGFLIAPTFMLGVWEDNGSGWKFLDGAGLTEAKMKMLFPETVGKLKLLERQPPVFQKNPG
jgi:hypothetical protein